MGDIKTIIGDRVRKHRTAQGLTQEQLAERAGLHSTFIGQIERGEKNATLTSIEKVTLALGITFETLFENIVPGETEKSIASQCYELVDTLNTQEQEAILGLIQKTIDYKKI